MDPQNPISGAASTFVKCLSCEKLVRLPANPDPNAIVRCPRCEQTYPIGVLLDSEIPELEVVSSDSSGEIAPPDDIQIKTDEQNRFIVAPALAKGAKRPKRRRSNRPSVTSQPDKQERPTRSKSPGSSSSSGRRRESRRQHRSEGSGRGFEFAKIIMGALMAPPFAQLVIWWGLQLDPLNLGPSVAKAVPILVPAKFHPAEDEPEDQNDLEKTTIENSKKSDSTEKTDSSSGRLPSDAAADENKGSDS